MGSTKLTMIQKVCLLVIFLFGSSLQTPGECRCPRGGIPSQVCGSDGKTYWNSCLAECKNVTVSCQEKCPCPTSSGTRIIDPAPASCKCPRGGLMFRVCGKNGRTYWNECLARCENTEMECRGECPCGNGGNVPRNLPTEPQNTTTATVTMCKCPRWQRQVCGKDGKTYFNDCQARCANADIECYGGCPCRGLRNQVPNLFNDNNGISVSNMWNAFLAYIQSLQRIQG